MATTEHAPAAPVETPPPATPAPETPVEETASLAEHEAAFSPPPRERDDKTGQFVPKPQTRHRAQKDAGRAEDVPRIRELTAKQKAAEQERDTYKAQVAELEARLRQPAPAETVQAPAQTPPKTREAAPESTNGGFAEAEPKLADFANTDDPYGEFVSARTIWRWQKQQFETNQQTEAARIKADDAIALSRIQGSFNARVDAFTIERPDFHTVVANGPKETVPILLQAAIMESDNGPAIVYHLAQHPELFYEMLLLTDGKAVTDVGLATTQALLSRRVQTVPTGSVVPPRSSPSPVPKPPNPVRTGPMKPSDEPPGDESSLADHEAAFGPKHGRRR